MSSSITPNIELSQPEALFHTYHVTQHIVKPSTVAPPKSTWKPNGYTPKQPNWNTMTGKVKPAQP